MREFSAANRYEILTSIRIEMIAREHRHYDECHVFHARLRMDATDFAFGD